MKILLENKEMKAEKKPLQLNDTSKLCWKSKDIKIRLYSKNIKKTLNKSKLHRYRFINGIHVYLSYGYFYNNFIGHKHNIILLMFL
jgi:hypothetical protein